MKRPETLWTGHPFYTRATVLAVDIGLRGIGICLRRGREQVYLKTVEFDLPDSDVLAGRRQKRALRHCRKNRKTRLHRLEKLFVRHGLPVPDEQALSRTDPFLLRHRAITGRLASSFALAIAIRHCLLRRGFDFHANSRGDFPWGDDASIRAAIAWMETSHITPPIGADLQEMLPVLHGKKKDAEDPDVAWAAERHQFLETLSRRLADSEREGIEESLAAYKASGGKKARMAARGRNFHRNAMEAHLRTIIDRHKHLIERPEEFLAALFLKPDPELPAKLQRRARERAIFHYHRKTRSEMEALWQRKTRRCRLAEAFGLKTGKAGESSDPDIRKWRVLEFLVFRRIECEVTRGKKLEKRTELLSLLPSEGLVHKILEEPVPNPPATWKEYKKGILDDLSAQVPGAKPLPASKFPANKDYFDQLRDLLCPTAASMRKTATIAPATARWLYSQATADGSSFAPPNVLKRLNEIDFFQKRKNPATEGPTYPQIKFLLGERAKRGNKRGERSVEGFLQKIFREHADRLDGALHPDFLVIECVGDAPRTVQQALMVEAEQKKRRAEREAQFEKAGFDDAGVISRRRRIALHAQQRGRCPYTGFDLPSPLDPSLELEHIFPAERGGLSVDANLALSFRWVNQLKGNRAPMEFAASPGDERILDWNGMLGVVENFKWGRRRESGNGADGQPLKKHDVFSFDARGGQIPDFGNTTRTAQLARQLVAEARDWMGIKDDPEAVRMRIGTPSGWLAAQARKSWALDADGEPLRKDRGQPQHHLVDAYVLAHIPPGEGMNHIRCNGIFMSEWEEETSEQGIVSRRPVTRAIRSVCPDFSRDVLPLLGWNPDTLPIYKHRPRKWARSLGDETFWRVNLHTGETFQRKPLARKDIPDAEALRQALHRTGVPSALIPTRSALEKWVGRPESDPTPLLLADGTPVRHVWKTGGKGGLRSPLGWSGRMVSGDGSISESAVGFRNLSVKAEALEIWLGWTGTKWELIKRRRADRVALKHLRRFTDAGHKGPAPRWMQEQPDNPDKHKTLEEIIFFNSLPAGAVKLAEVRRGDVRRMSVGPDGISPRNGERTSWWMVTALNSTSKVEFKCLLPLPEEWGLKATKECSEAAQLLAVFRPDLPRSTPAELAALLGLTPPAPPS